MQVSDLPRLLPPKPKRGGGIVPCGGIVVIVIFGRRPWTMDTLRVRAVIVDVNRDYEVHGRRQGVDDPQRNAGGGDAGPFDFITLPHLVLKVMGSRQRIAATFI